MVARLTKSFWIRTSEVMENSAHGRPGGIQPLLTVQICKVPPTGLPLQAGEEAVVPFRLVHAYCRCFHSQSTQLSLCGGPLRVKIRADATFDFCNSIVSR